MAAGAGLGREKQIAATKPGHMIYNRGEVLPAA